MSASGESSNAPSPLATRSVVLFLVIAMGAPWFVEWSLLRTGHRFDVSETNLNLKLMGLMYFPAMAAWFVRRVIEGDTTRLWFRPKPLHVLGILFAAPFVFLAIYGLSLGLGWVQFDPELRVFFSQLVDQSNLPPRGVVLGASLFASMSFGLFVSVFITLGEALGWTAFLLPRLLQRFPVWPVAVAIGVLMGAWYAPLVYGGYQHPQFPFEGTLVMTAFCVAVSFMLTAAWLRTQNVLVAAVVLAAIQAQNRGVWTLLFPAGGVKPLLGGSYGVAGVMVLGVVGGLWLHLELIRLREQGESVPQE